MLNMASLFDAALAHEAVCKQWVQASGKPIILFGAGMQGKKTLNILRSAGIEPLCFVDETPTKQGSLESGLPIFSLEKSLSITGNDPTIIVCLFTPKHRYLETKKRITSICDSAIVIPFFSAWLACLGDAFECYYLSAPKIESRRLGIYQKLYSELHDNESRTTLLDHLRFRFFHDTSILPTPRTSIPFLAHTLSKSNLVYVDCGAYDGDTVQEFIANSKSKFQHIYALEPDSSNRRKMRVRLQTYPSNLIKKISIIPKAVWKESCDIGFNSAGDMSSLVDNDSNKKIEAISLDDLLCNVTGPIHIKLDVEGVEIEALHGAKELINLSRPTWAISVYHKPNDLAMAYALLSQSKNQYKFSLRCHGGDGTDLILYAW